MADDKTLRPPDRMQQVDDLFPESLGHTSSNAGRHTGRTIGHYTVLEPLGKGGMGEVYLALDPQLGRKVALKVLPHAFTADPDRVRRFKQEAKAASGLNHPNILTVHEIGREGELHFIATEYIEGETLRQRITKERMNLSEALEVAIQVAAALAAAHAVGIVHRDIKPENIMLRPDGYIKLLDFGLAKLMETTPVSSDTRSLTTAPGAVVGTLSYMSPEQVSCQPVDARADIWSLGVVLYEMVAGGKPFAGTSAAVMVSILDGEPIPLSHYLEQVTPGLESIVTKALRKNRDERFQTAQEFAQELKQFKRRLEIDGHAITRETRRSSFRTPIAAAAVVLIALAGIGVWLWLKPQSATRSAPVSTAVTERLVTYSLTVQKMRDGKPYQEPFESSGQEIFENGWKFRLNLSSPQPGFLYLLNEGPAPGGRITFNLLFPLPASNTSTAPMPANQRIQTGWYVFDEHPGTEKFWLIWAAQPVSELDRVRVAANPTIQDANHIAALREFLTRHAESKFEVERDKIKKQTTAKGQGEILAALVELEHH
jgi:serine/threonine protein kinase